MLGFALDRVLADPRRGHPVGGFGRIAEALERRTWRPRRRAGALHVALLLVAVWWIGGRAGRSFPCLSLIVWITLGGRSLEEAALTMGELLGASALP